MTFLRQVLDVLKGRRLFMAGSVLCGLLFAGANLLPPLLIRQLIQWVTQGDAEAGELLALSGALLGVYLLRGAARYGYGWFSHVTAYRVMHDLMTRIYAHLQRLPHRFFNDQRTGGLITRSINDVEAIEDFIAHGIPETILAAIIPLSMIVVLLTLDAELTLVVLLPIPVAALLVYRYVSKVRKMWRGVRERLSELVAVVQDNLSGIAVIKSFVQERNRARLVERHSEAFRREIIRANTVSLLPAGIIEATGGVGIVLVIWSGGRLALEGQIPVADLFVFIVYMAHIYQPFLQLASINDVLQKAAASTDRIYQLLAETSEIEEKPGAVAPREIRWSVDVEGVSFGYTPGERVLEDVSFTIPEGGIVALVGPTGAGKSTISSLLPRFYDPDAGCVRLGGHDLRDLPLDFVRSSVASVLQDVFLFHGTVRENILFGAPDASDADLTEAVAAANAQEFIRRLPNGLDSVVGERGVRLSGGQKQRLSIARALLKNAPVLVLDEATSSVDAETEALIQEAISRLTQDRTTLVIAHRLSTVRHADRILVLEDGRVVETGDHDELMALGGLYARMVQSQDLSRRWEIAREADARTAD